jgi:hypothetical protein
MRAVAIKKSSREKALGFQEMGNLRCDGCGEEFFIATVKRRWIGGLQKSKQSGLRRSLPKSTSATRNTPTESNCLSSRLQFWTRRLLHGRTA